jgi:hypothetical protein
MALPKAALACLYVVSLPERLLRAGIGIIGGSALALVDVLLPAAVRRMTLYRILMGDSLRYAVERLAGMQPLSGGEAMPPLPRDYHARKLAGTAVEGVSLIAVQFSPLWVLAIAGDAAAGSKLFLNRLAWQLKEDGMLRQDARIDSLVDLLDAVHRASRASATTIDTPPLSRADFEMQAAELRSAYRQVFAGSVDLLARLEALWSRMQQTSFRSGIPLPLLADYMAGINRNWFRKGGKVVRSLGRTGSDLVGEQILQGYQQTLEDIASGGVRDFLRVRFLPYFHAARKMLMVERRSWTEMALLRMAGAALEPDL